MKKRVIAAAAMWLLGATLFAANKPVTVAVKDGTGKEVGTARISDGPGGQGVRIALNLKDLPPGEHAIHIHAIAKWQKHRVHHSGRPLQPNQRAPRD